MTNWNEDTVERFRKRCLETSDSYTIIGAAFGVTRNAAIGKARRIGIDLQRPNARFKKPRQLVPSAPRPPSRAKTIRPITPLRSPTAKTLDIPKYVFDETAPPPECLMVDLIDLNSCNCHWPIGVETPQKFCGLPQGESKQQPYCDFHHQLGTRK